MARPITSRHVLLLSIVTLTGCDGPSVRELLPWERFSMASTSMEPTLPQGTHLTAESVALADLARGDIVVVRHNEDKWVVRLAGLPGDRIALVDGIVVLNGKHIGQRPIGTWKITDSVPGRETEMLSERFPKERRSHRILDDGITPGDNFEEVTLGPDRYFLLGDNRDHSADSRYNDEFVGLGLVKGEDILRRLEPPER